MAASALSPEEVVRRYQALELGAKKVLKLDEFMERKAAEKRAREMN